MIVALQLRGFTVRCFIPAQARHTPSTCPAIVTLVPRFPQKIL
jgi:hypothetical protein